MENALQLCGFDFDMGAIERIMKAADTNGDGVVEYKEFVPMMLELVLERESDEAAKLSLGQYSEAQLEVYFRRLFGLADANGDGVLQVSEVSGVHA